MIKAFGIALIGAMLTFVLKAFGWKGAPLLAVASVTLLLALTLERIESLFSLFDLLTGTEGVGDGVECVLKILGLSYAAGISADISRELGESGIANAVTTVARIEALVIVSPMIVEIITLGLELIE
jgi:hypothetical protein